MIKYIAIVLTVIAAGVSYGVWRDVSDRQQAQGVARFYDDVRKAEANDLAAGGHYK